MFSAVSHLAYQNSLYLSLDYANEQFVGAAIRESGLPREDLWVTGKYGGRDDDVQGAVRTSLRKLGLAHFDLYLVHTPWSIVNDDVERLWGRMVDIREAGLAKYVVWCGVVFWLLAAAFD